MVYRNIAEALDLNEHHTYAEEVNARANFISAAEALPGTTISFRTPVFYKRYVIVKSLKEPE